MGPTVPCLGKTKGVYVGEELDEGCADTVGLDEGDQVGLDEGLLVGDNMGLAVRELVPHVIVIVYTPTLS